MECINCGSKEQTGSFCSICGTKIGSGTSNASRKNSDAEYDSYEKVLEEKKRSERRAKAVTSIFSVVMCLIAIWNNWGYREFGEIVVICMLTIVVVIAVYNAIAAKMGFYKAEEYLKKYVLLKKEMGSAKAIKIMEETINIWNSPLEQY